MAFSFGGQAAKPNFGTATTTATGIFGGFGTAAAPATTTSSFSFGGFGGTGATAAAPSLGFGTTTATAAPSFGFGGTATTTQALGFGTATTTTSAFSFGTGSGFGASSTGFGLGASSAPSAFGTGIGGTTSLGSLGTGIGTGVANLGGLGQQQAQRQQQHAASNVSNMATAVSLPVIFGDERDAIIAKWNQLQAFWGTGRGFFNQQGHYADFSPDNPFCSFKAVGYSCMPKAKNEDGFVAIIFNKKFEDIRKNQQQVVDTLSRAFGSKPNMSVCVEGVKQLPEDKTEMTIYLQERAATGMTKRIVASEVYAFLTQAHIRTQLVAQPLLVENVIQKTGFTPEHLKQYLDSPPSGINPLIWNQAKLDNPDPLHLIPVPMVGFKELHNRLKHQEQQTRLHQGRLDVIAQDIGHLQRSHSNILSKIDEYKRRHLELGHRVLQVMVKQEVYRKLGYAIQVEEEQLRAQLECCQAELNAPTQFKGRLNELMSQLRMQNQLGAQKAESTYQMDESVQLEIRQHLKQQQEGLRHLINIVKDDLEDLQLIEQGLSDNVKISHAS